MAVGAPCEYICLSWSRSRGKLSLLLVLFPQVYSCLLWPTPCLAVCSNGSYFALNPFLAYWRLNTSVQVNIMSALHDVHTDTHIYITSILQFILFFTLLPLLLAGRLPLTFPSGTITVKDKKCPKYEKECQRHVLCHCRCLENPSVKPSINFHSKRPWLSPSQYSSQKG
jgi:hypothetical protein